MNPILHQIADYMSNHKDRAGIDPLEIGAELLPHLFILEIERHDAASPPRLRIRLSGTALDQAFGRCVMGHYLEEFLHGPRSIEVLNGFRRCATTKVPLWMRQVVHITERPPRYVEGVVFYVTPELIFGGLILGEISDLNSASSFESRQL